MNKIIKTSEFIFWFFFSPLLMIMPSFYKKDRYCFLVHPRDINDFIRPYPFFRFMPKKIIRIFAYYSWPFRASKITGLKCKETGKDIMGYIIGIPMMADQMLANREKAAKRVFSAIKLAERLGCGVVGLGMFTSVVTSGGESIGAKKKCFVVNGNTTTALAAYKTADILIKKRNLKKNRVKIAVVGSTGSTGRAISYLLSADDFREIILIARNTKNLSDLKDGIEKSNPGCILSVSCDIKDINDADVVIVATSSAENLIKTEHLKNNALVVDITQPRNIPEDILTKRKDVLIVDGGLIDTAGINYNFNLGIKRGQAFACLCETLLVAAENINRDFVGHASAEDVLLMSGLLNKYGFNLSKFTSFGREISHYG